MALQSSAASTKGDHKMTTATAKRIRQPKNKPTTAELYENYQRDGIRRRDVETEYRAIGHAINAYLIRHTSKDDRIDADNEYFNEQYAALHKIEARLCASLESARAVETASRTAWLDRL